ncbi:MAG: Mrp/NBP35 family ATP-binding protein [Paludibacter sp.]|nr:Mrp/NBP35 family ATP-binding protein [Paludibacter sp.]
MPVKKNVLENIKKIILVSSGKGGVGKSTVAAGLALSLAREGYSVGLLDADIFGPSVPTLFQLGDAGRPSGTDKNGKKMMLPFEKFGLKIMSIGFFVEPSQAVIWRGPMVTNVLRQLLTETDWGKLDFLIVDTPPGTGDVHITLMQEFYVSGAIVVTTPQKVALDDVHRAIGMLTDDAIGAPVLGIVENMAWFTPTKHPDEKYFLFGKGGGELLSKKYNVPLLAQIPMNEGISENCDSGRVAGMFDDKNIEQAFDQLASKVMTQKQSFKYIKN